MWHAESIPLYSTDNESSIAGVIDIIEEEWTTNYRTGRYTHIIDIFSEG
jgi:hypothetical protein